MTRVVLTVWQRSNKNVLSAGNDKNACSTDSDKYTCSNGSKKNARSAGILVLQC